VESDTTRAVSHQSFALSSADTMLFSFPLKQNTGVVGIRHTYLIKIPNTKEVQIALFYLKFTETSEIYETLMGLGLFSFSQPHL